MGLHYDLTDFPVADMIVLRRLAVRDDPDIDHLLSLFQNERNRLTSRLNDVEDELQAIRLDQEEVDVEDTAAHDATATGVGRPPFGTKADEMVIVEEILSLKRRKFSFGQIARYLNAKGCLTPSGKNWRTQSVINVFRRHGTV